MPGPEIRAIRTVYRDRLFRSRLEARWAVLFDAAGVTWEFEPEGYELSDGSCYLPDFLLPTFHTLCGIYAEVKPPGGDFSKAKRFSVESGKPIALLEGPPSLIPCPIFHPPDGTFGGVSIHLHLPVEAVRFATGYSFWEPTGGTPTRLRDIIHRRPRL